VDDRTCGRAHRRHAPDRPRTQRWPALRRGALPQTTLGVAQLRRTRRRNRPRFLSAALFEPAPGIGQPRRATLPRAERLGQLIAAPITEPLVFFGVHRFGFGDHLARDLLVVTGRALRRIRRWSCDRAPSCAAITRNATSSSHARSIVRDDLVPRAYA
jgi:hypothetical protein